MPKLKLWISLTLLVSSLFLFNACFSSEEPVAGIIVNKTQEEDRKCLVAGKVPYCRDIEKYYFTIKTIDNKTTKREVNRADYQKFVVGTRVKIE